MDLNNKCTFDGMYSKIFFFLFLFLSFLHILTVLSFPKVRQNLFLGSTATPCT